MDVLCIMKVLHQVDVMYSGIGLCRAALHCRGTFLRKIAVQYRVIGLSKGAVHCGDTVLHRILYETSSMEALNCCPVWSFSPREEKCSNLFGI